MEQILQHIADEQEIKDFHAWISQLCHPDSPVANVQHFDQIQSDHQAKLESLRANRKDNLSLTSTNQEHAGSGQRILRALANKFVSISSLVMFQQIKCFSLSISELL